MDKHLHKDIGDQFSDEINKLSQQPPEHIWENIDKALDKADAADYKDKFTRLRKRTLVLLFMLIGISTFSVVYFNTAKNKNTLQVAVHNDNSAAQKSNGKINNDNNNNTVIGKQSSNDINNTAQKQIVAAGVIDYATHNTEQEDLFSSKKIFINKKGKTVVKVTNGTVTGSALSLSTSGDQVLAYQGSSTSPTFISAIHMNVYSLANFDPVSTTAAVWDGTNSNNTSASALPPGLTTGTNAIWIGTQDVPSSEKDNAAFNCSGNTSTIANLRAALNNQANWITSNITASFTLPISCSVLPIELVSFEAKAQNHGTKLNWLTASELNNSYFIVERSFDTKQFENIGKINSHDNATTPQYYIFIDEKPFNGINYYRLKQVDNNGTFTYSKIVSATNSANGSLVIYPSITEGVVSLQYLNNPMQSIDVFNANGLLMMTKNLNKEAQNIVQLNLSTLPEGLYILSIKTENGFASGRVYKSKE